MRWQLSCHGTGRPGMERGDGPLSSLSPPSSVPCLSDGSSLVSLGLQGHNQARGTAGRILACSCWVLPAGAEPDVCGDWKPWGKFPHPDMTLAPGRCLILLGMSRFLNEPGH